MRWVALGVDYEMAGKDLIDSVKLSGEIARALGGEPPEGFNYELFLDEKGQKISKSKGNGLTIDEWLAYGTPESLALFMYSKPREAKRLYFDVIPRHVDEYQSFLERYQRQDVKQRLANPVWHIHAGDAADARDRSARRRRPLADHASRCCSTWSAVANAETKDVLWGFIRNYAPGVSPENHPQLDALVGYAIRYFQDFVKPAKRYRAADAEEARGARGAFESPLSPCRLERQPPKRSRRPSTTSAAPFPLPGLEGQGRDAGAAGRLERLVQHALPDPARRGARAALRLVRGHLRHRRDAGADRQGAVGRADGRARGIPGRAGGLSPPVAESPRSSNSSSRSCPAALWRDAEARGTFDGAGVDLADGYIHFSTAAQVRDTAALHFRGQDDLLLIAVDASILGVALRFEPSRGGDLFPHLYGVLPLDAVRCGEAVADRSGGPARLSRDIR